MFGKIHYDVRVEPRDVQEEERLLAQRLMDAEQSKSKLQIISRNKASSIINPGTAGAVGWGGNFIVSVSITPWRALIAHIAVEKYCTDCQAQEG